jgi:hypothetical protein
VWLNENKNNNEKKQKAKHDPDICRSKVYVYYDVFKVIFLMLMLGFKLMILGLWLTVPPSYAIGCEHVLNLHKCVLNGHAVWYGCNTAQSVDSVRIPAADMCL